MQRQMKRKLLRFPKSDFMKNQVYADLKERERRTLEKLKKSVSFDPKVNVTKRDN